MLKKSLICISQIAIILILYEIFVRITWKIMELLLNIPQHLPKLFQRNATWMIEGLIYTILPALMALAIVIPVVLIYQKTKIYIVTLIVTSLWLLYIYIQNILFNISAFGLFSWDFVNSVWIAVIVCSIIIGCLYFGSNLKISIKEKKEE